MTQPREEVENPESQNCTRGYYRWGFVSRTTEQNVSSCANMALCTSCNPMMHGTFKHSEQTVGDLGRVMEEGCVGRPLAHEQEIIPRRKTEMSLCKFPNSGRGLPKEPMTTPRGEGVGFTTC